MKQVIKNFIQTAGKRITRAHILQSVIACAYIFLVFFILNLFENGLSIASLGASTFIAFSFPETNSSRSRFLIGGYCTGIASGLLCAKINVLSQNFFPFPNYIIICALAVFLSMILMTILGFEHPPSVALAVSVAIDSNPIVLSVAALGCIIVLCILKELLKKHLYNLHEKKKDDG